MLALVAAGVVAAPSLAIADGPTTFTNSAAIAIPVAGATNEIGSANPYPSPITVSGMAGAVTSVKVVFNSLTHGSVNDIDALVVAPTGADLVVLSDVGDRTDGASLAFAENASLTFDDAAPGAVPIGNILTGTYKPTNNGPVDAFASPAPTPSGQTTLAGAFTGIDPNGVWQLFIVDDNTGDLGQMAGGWSLIITTETSSASTTTTVTSSGTPSLTGSSVTFSATVRAGGSPVTAGTVAFTADGASLGSAPVNASGVAQVSTSALAEGTHTIVATYGGSAGYLGSNGSVSQRVDNPTVATGRTFCNTGPLSIPGAGSAAPYPSHITVSGLTGPVTKVTAQLRGVAHAAPIDLDILLSGPTPATNVMLMSDTGGNGPVSGLTLTFDDTAPSGVPSPLVSGTFRPTDSDADAADAAFPAPAPTFSSATALSTFDGVSGNGQWSLWVVDDATGDAGSISDGWCLTVLSASATTTTVTSSPNPSTVGQPVAVTATVTSSGTPVTAGTVTFTDGATTLAAGVPLAANGTATLTSSILTVGTHAITATYSGTDDFVASSGTVSQVVELQPTSTALTSSVNPSAVGDSVTLTATVSAAGAPVTAGTVAFTDGATTLAAGVPVAADGTATLTSSILAVGTHAITATYSGTAAYATSTDDLSQVVGLRPTTTVITSSVNPSIGLDSTTFTVTVTSDGASVSGGSITIGSGGSSTTQPLGELGITTYTTNGLRAGTHEITATYSGTAVFAGSSDSLTQVVNPRPTTTVLTTSGTPSLVGEPVTFTATVSTSVFTADGSVTFTDGATTLAADVPVSGGSATLTTTALTAGTHTITATYSNTAYFGASSASVTQVVETALTSTALTADVNPSLIGDSVTFTAVVTSGGTPVADGTVTFADGAATLAAEVPVSADGTATLTTDALAAGSHEITATYSGTSVYQASTGTLTEVVDEPPSADAGGPYAIAEGESLALDGSGSSAGATYEWFLNADGTPDAASTSPTLTWAQLERVGIDDGPHRYTITLRVTSSGLTAEDTAIVDVTNTAPRTVLTGDLTATAGKPFTIKVGADDPSSADMAALFTYVVDWGDGSPIEEVTGPADPPVTHTYTAAGDFAATFAATDKDGGQGGSFSVSVAAGPALADTGSDPRGALGLAVLLLAVGALALGVSIRRRSMSGTR